MKPWIVHSSKYDGSLHYRYRTSVVREEPDLLVLYCGPGTPLESYRGALVTLYHSLEFYWSDRYYNLSVNWYADWRPRMHYVNVATPAVWHVERATLSYVDLDLDVIWRAETNDVILDDEDEFVLHQERFGYPADLVARALETSQALLALARSRAYPFDGSLLTWRPDGST